METIYYYRFSIDGSYYQLLLKNDDKDFIYLSTNGEYCGHWMNELNKLPKEVESIIRRVHKLYFSAFA
jgi:hypothetical protein